MIKKGEVGNFPAWIEVLVSLRQTPGLTNTNIQFELRGSYTSVCQTIEKLITAGLIKRKKANGRNYSSYLTKKGEKLANSFLRIKRYMKKEGYMKKEVF